MARVVDDHELGFGPRPVQVPRRHHRRAHVVPPLHDDTGDPAQGGGILDQLLPPEPAVVHEVVVLDPRERGRGGGLRHPLDRLGVAAQADGRRLPARPRDRRRNVHGRIGVAEPAVVRLDEPGALQHRNGCDELLPQVGEDRRCTALVEPLDLVPPQREDPAQHQLGDRLGVALRVGERQCTAPRPPEHLPPRDAEVLAQQLEVGHQVPGRVVAQVGIRLARVWRAVPRPALVEQDDAIPLRVEEAAMPR